MTSSTTSPLSNFVNIPDLLDRVENDRELLNELFLLFRTEFPRLQIELEDACSLKDMRRIVKAAHMLKGMLANLSFERAATAVEAIEQMAAKEDRAGIESALTAFNSEVANLLPSLDAYLAEQEI